MLQFLDSAQSYVVGDATAGKWTSLQSNAFANSIGAFGRRGANAHRFTFSATGNAYRYLQKTLPIVGARAVIGLAFKYTGPLAAAFSIPLLAIRNNATAQVSLAIRQDGKLEIWNGSAYSGEAGTTLLDTGSAPLSSGVYYFLEWDTTIANSGGTSSLRINNVLDINITGADTQHDATAEWDVFSMGIQFISGLFFGIPSSTLDYCDIRVFDGQTVDRDGHPTANYQPIGDRQVLRLSMLTGNGSHTDASPSAGVNHGDMVKETTNDGDSTYLSDATVGHKESLLLENLPTSGTVSGIQADLVVRKVDAGDRLIGNLLVINGIDYIGPDLAPSETYAHLLTPYDNSPATHDPFSVSEVNAMEEGFAMTG